MIRRGSVNASRRVMWRRGVERAAVAARAIDVMRGLPHLTHERVGGAAPRGYVLRSFFWRSCMLRKTRATMLPETTMMEMSETRTTTGMYPHYKLSDP